MVLLEDWETFTLSCASDEITLATVWWFQNSKIDVGIDVTAATKQKCTSLGMQNSCGSQTVDASFLGIDFADGIAKTTLYVQYHCEAVTIL